jgi:hypothetical protein
VISHTKRLSAQVAVGLLSILVAAALAVLLGWFALQFAEDLVGAFEVIAYVVGWILLPFRI